MAAPGEEMTATTAAFASPNIRALSQENGRTLGKQNLFKQDVKQATGKVDNVDMMLTCFDHFQRSYTSYVLSPCLTL